MASLAADGHDPEQTSLIFLDQDMKALFGFNLGESWQQQVWYIL
jgi:hypothetical protein